MLSVAHGLGSVGLLRGSKGMTLSLAARSFAAQADVGYVAIANWNCSDAGAFFHNGGTIFQPRVGRHSGMPRVPRFLTRSIRPNACSVQLTPAREKTVTIHHGKRYCTKLLCGLHIAT